MIKEVVMFTVICDNCGRDSNAGQEFSCWGEREHAEDLALDSFFIKEGENHYCPDCFSYDEEDNLILKTIDKKIKS
jgi:hypothetical protein